MEPWKRVTAMITVIAFSTKVRPMDSFLTSYLTGPGVHATLGEVSNMLTPMTIKYSVLGSLLVFIFSDYLRYKPVMVFCGLMGMLAYACLIDSSSLFVLKMYEICYAFLSCVDPIYFSYLFAIIKDKKQYQIATGYATAGLMSGMSVSGLLGQLVVYLNNGSYDVLLKYSLAGVTIAFVVTLLLPSVKYENSPAVDDAKKDVFSKEVIYDPKILKYSSEKVDPKNIDGEPVRTNILKCVYEDITYAYTNPKVLRWTLWHSIGIAGYVQIILYVNILFTYIADVSNDKNMLLNGLVNSLVTISAAVCTYKIGKINVDWSRYGDSFLAVSSLTLGLTMFLCYYVKNIIVVYIVYTCYYTIIQSVFVISTSQIGKQVKNGCYALVLGFCIFLGIMLSMLSSTILTLLEISIPEHFLVYSGIYTAAGIAYASVACFNGCATAKTRRFSQLPP